MQSLFDHDHPVRHHRAFRVVDRYVGQFAADAGGDPDYKTPIAQRRHRPRDDADALGMPPPKFGAPPVTYIRNTSSPHLRGWLKPENRCLVPANSFSEYAPANPLTKKDVVVRS